MVDLAGRRAAGEAHDPSMIELSRMPQRWPTRYADHVRSSINRVVTACGPWQLDADAMVSCIADAAMVLQTIEIGIDSVTGPLIDSVGSATTVEFDSSIVGARRAAWTIHHGLSRSVAADAASVLRTVDIHIDVDRHRTERGSLLTIDTELTRAIALDAADLLRTMSIGLGTPIAPLIEPGEPAWDHAARQPVTDVIDPLRTIGLGPFIAPLIRAAHVAEAETTSDSITNAVHALRTNGPDHATGPRPSSAHPAATDTVVHLLGTERLQQEPTQAMAVAGTRGSFVEVERPTARRQLYHASVVLRLWLARPYVRTFSGLVALFGLATLWLQLKVYRPDMAEIVEFVLFLALSLASLAVCWKR